MILRSVMRRRSEIRWLTSERWPSTLPVLVAKKSLAGCVPCSSRLQASRLSLGLEQLQVPHAERLGELIEGQHGRIPPSALQPAYVLLTEARTFRELLLGKPFLLP